MDSIVTFLTKLFFYPHQYKIVVKLEARKQSMIFHPHPLNRRCWLPHRQYHLHCLPHRQMTPLWSFQNVTTTLLPLLLQMRSDILMYSVSIFVTVTIACVFLGLHYVFTASFHKYLDYSEMNSDRVRNGML